MGDGTVIRLLIAFFLVLSTPAYADNELVKTHAPVKLERVIDGDTIVASGIKIRLWGIDTPEKDEPLFLAAKMLLESLTQDGELRCKFIEEDRYARGVMHCLIDDIDIGSVMVQMGMARDYSKYSGNYYQYEEDLAKREQRGIWKDTTATTSEPVMCTMEAKECPDGSSVSRTGPNCEFAVCPGSAKARQTTVEAESGFIFIVPDPPKQSFDPDYPIVGFLPSVLSVEFLVEHRSVLHKRDITVRGVITSALLGEQACPPDRGMCAQPRVTLEDTQSTKDYNVVVLFPEDDNRRYVVGQMIEISGTAWASSESVMIQAAP